MRPAAGQLINACLAPLGIEEREVNAPDIEALETRVSVTVAQDGVTVAAVAPSTQIQLAEVTGSFEVPDWLSADDATVTVRESDGTTQLLVSSSSGSLPADVSVERGRRRSVAPLVEISADFSKQPKARQLLSDLERLYDNWNSRAVESRLRADIARRSGHQVDDAAWQRIKRMLRGGQKSRAFHSLVQTSEALLESGDWTATGTVTVRGRTLRAQLTLGHELHQFLEARRLLSIARSSQTPGH